MNDKIDEPIDVIVQPNDIVRILLQPYRRVFSSFTQLENEIRVFTEELKQAQEYFDQRHPENSYRSAEYLIDKNTLDFKKDKIRKLKHALDLARLKQQRTDTIFYSKANHGS